MYRDEYEIVCGIRIYWCEQLYYSIILQQICTSLNTLQISCFACCMHLYTFYESFMAMVIIMSCSYSCLIWGCAIKVLWMDVTQTLGSLLFLKKYVAFRNVSCQSALFSGTEMCFLFFYVLIGIPNWISLVQKQRLICYIDERTHQYCFWANSSRVVLKRGVKTILIRKVIMFNFSCRLLSHSYHIARSDYNTSILILLFCISYLSQFPCSWLLHHLATLMSFPQDRLSLSHLFYIILVCLCGCVRLCGLSM